MGFEYLHIVGHRTCPWCSRIISDVYSDGTEDRYPRERHPCVSRPVTRSSDEDSDSHEREG